MTQERLEELIKQGATIWSNTIWYHGKIHLINSDTDEYRIIEDNFGNVCLSHHTKGTDDCYDGQWALEELREDVDCAEWEYKTHAERTERFEPPMWEDIQGWYCFRFISNNDFIEFMVNYDYYEETTRYDCNEIKIFNESQESILFSEPATKENYIKACEIVRDLFKGKNER